jgi:hypothetical protein
VRIILGRSEARVVGRHRHVAGAQQSEPARERMAVHAGEDRQRAFLDLLEQVDHVVPRPGEVDVERRTLDVRLEVGAGAERLLAGPGQHDRPRPRVGGRGSDPASDGRDHRLVDRVAPLGAIEGDPLHRTTPLDEHRLGHAAPPRHGPLMNRPH